jgi:hypothetical protein
MSYFLLYGVLALWVLFDGVTRKMGASTVLWVLGTVLLGPIILPIYLALRPLKQGELREGGTAWNVLKNFAILWTIVMVIVTIAVLMNVADVTKGLNTEAERAGAGLGTLIGMAVLGAIWFFPTIGAAVLGFLLKKSTVVETGPTGPLVGQTSSASPVGGWAGVIAAAVLGLIALVVLANTTKREHPSESATSSESVSTASPATNEWSLIESSDKMDNTPVVILRKSGTGGATMTIRCAKRKTEAYVDTDTILDNGNVRVKFDVSSPIRQTWGKSTDDKALFAPDPITFARTLTKTKTFLLEFTPFQEGTRTISFDVTKLDEKLGRISDACNWEAVDRSREQGKIADAQLRARLVQYVHSCENQEIGKWCWSDPNDTLFYNDNGYSDTRDGALADAMRSARWGLAFKNAKKADVGETGENDSEWHAIKSKAECEAKGYRWVGSETDTQSAGCWKK